MKKNQKHMSLYQAKNTTDVLQIANFDQPVNKFVKIRHS